MAAQPTTVWCTKLDTTGHQTVLYSFTGATDGGYPTSGVIRDSAGNLYGTAGVGGTANGGVVYKVSAAGQETVLYSFTGGVDGKSPSGGVIRDPAGNLYGTTEYGGTGNAGMVYKLDPAGQETVLQASRAVPMASFPTQVWSATPPATSTGLLRWRPHPTAGVVTSWMRRARRRCCTNSRAVPMGKTPTQV